MNKKTKKAVTTKKAKRAPLSPMNFKVTDEDRKTLHKLADKHCQGNVSVWLRHAGLNYVPKKGEQAKVYPKTHR